MLWRCGLLVSGLWPPLSLVTITVPGTAPNCTLRSTQHSPHSVYPTRVWIPGKTGWQFCGVSETWPDLVWGSAEGGLDGHVRRGVPREAEQPGNTALGSCELSCQGTSRRVLRMSGLGSPGQDTPGPEARPRDKSLGSSNSQILAL